MVPAPAIGRCGRPDLMGQRELHNQEANLHTRDHRSLSAPAAGLRDRPRISRKHSGCCTSRSLGQFALRKEGTMPANTPLNEPPPAIAEGDPTADSQDPDLATAGRQPAAGPGSSPADEILSPSERFTAERTERRRQRAAAREAPTPPREPRRAHRRERPTESTSAVTPSRRMTLRDSVSMPLIAVVAAGGVLGAILGALSAAGWVIGLLAAGLTIVLSALLRRYSGLT